MLELFALQVAVFSIFPLYFTSFQGSIRKAAFYIYIALVLLIGGFFGNVYSLPISPDINVSGGNLCYGAFMMSVVMFVLVERDVLILRHIVKLVVLVDLFNVVFSALVAETLQHQAVINPHNISAELFNVSTAFIILGGVLILLELFTLLFAFEKLKKLNLGFMITGSLYVALFIVVLCFDGIAFPLIAFGFSPEIVAIVFGGLDGKVLTASAYAVPLLLFVLLKRHTFVSYLQADNFRWGLLFTTSRQLLEDMENKNYQLEQAATVFSNASEGLAFINSDGRILHANETFCTMLGLSGSDFSEQYQLVGALFQVNGRFIELATVLSEHWRGEVRFGDGYQHQGLLAVNQVASLQSKRATFVFSLVNIDEQKRVQDRLRYLARHDQLTLLPNRRVLDEHLSAVAKQDAALLVIDLDHFKDVNDSYGHGAGDNVLQHVASRLTQIQNRYRQEVDLLSRTGGDEFALLINRHDLSLIERIITDIQSSLKPEMQIGEQTYIYTSATIGASMQRRGEQRNLLQEADTSLYEAKRNRRGSYGLYEDRLTKQSQRKLMLSFKLKAALESQGLQVFYQPQFSPHESMPIGVEALARWHDDELGWISPAEFIPIAEETGNIEKLGHYVLRQACFDGANWHTLGFAQLKVSVNVSAYQLRFGHFIETLTEVLQESRFPAKCLELELTESVYIEREKEVLPLLNQIKAMGVCLAIDDFGTGYSSLSYLSKIPWDTLKIDRSFIIDIPQNEEQCQLTSTIITMAHDLRLTIVVEGVETAEQLAFVEQRGCQLIQGYYYSPPMDKTRLEQRLELG